MSVVSTNIRITVTEDVYRIFVLLWNSYKDFANDFLSKLDWPTLPLAQLAGQRQLTAGVLATPTPNYTLQRDTSCTVPVQDRRRLPSCPSHCMQDGKQVAGPAYLTTALPAH